MERAVEVYARVTGTTFPGCVSENSVSQSSTRLKPGEARQARNAIRLLFLVVLFFAGALFGGAARGATHIQQASFSDITSRTYTSLTLTFPSATAPGNAILLAVTYGNTNPSITVTDSFGNAYAQAVKTYDSGHHQGVAIFYATNIKGGASARVTLKFSGAVAYLAVGVHEYSGIAAASALDVVSGRLGTGSTPANSSVSTTANGDLIFGAGVEDAIGSGCAFTAGSGFIKHVDLGQAASYADEDQTQTVSGPIAATWKLSPSSDWIASMAAFKSSGGGSAPPPPPPPGQTAPSISGISPTSGGVNTLVTISGTNFGNSQGNSNVSFNGVAASPTNWSSTTIKAPVPSGATTGKVAVTVAGQTATGPVFTVQPVSVQVSPTSANVQVNQSVSLSANVQNDPQNRGVSWSLSGQSCTGTDCGTLSQNTSTSVTYTAPATVPNSPGVTVTATAFADGTKAASAAISVAAAPTPPPGGGGSGIPTFAENHVSGSNTLGYTVSSYVLRLPNATLQGNCIIVGFEYSASSGSRVSISDDQGNVYSTPVSHDDGNQIVNLSYALNVRAGTQKITLTFSGAMPNYVSGLASEFYNIAPANALDGSSGGDGSGTNVTAAAFTPNTSGDLIYHYAVQDRSSDPMISWSQGSGPWTLLSADLFDGSAAQYQVQSSAASITPAFSMAPSQNFNSVAIALKPASAGTPPPDGIRVVRVQHHALPPYTSSPTHLQFPSTGNLLVVAWIGVPDHTLSGVTDGNGNSYTSTGAPFQNGLSGENQIFYAANASTSTTMSGPVLTTSGVDISGSTAVLLDVRGAASSPFDSTAGHVVASGVQHSAGDVTAASITPSTANGLIISTIGVDSNTVNGMPRGNFLSFLPSPISSPNRVSQNNGWALIYNSGTGPQTFVWTTQDGAVEDWASIAVAFKAAPPPGN